MNIQELGKIYRSTWLIFVKCTVYDEALKGTQQTKYAFGCQGELMKGTSDEAAAGLPPVGEGHPRSVDKAAPFFGPLELPWRGIPALPGPGEHSKMLQGADCELRAANEAFTYRIVYTAPQQQIFTKTYNQNKLMRISEVLSSRELQNAC